MAVGGLGGGWHQGLVQDLGEVGSRHHNHTLTRLQGTQNRGRWGAVGGGGVGGWGVCKKSFHVRNAHPAPPQSPSHCIAEQTRHSQRRVCMCLAGRGGGLSRITGKLVAATTITPSLGCSVFWLFVGRQGRGQARQGQRHVLGEGATFWECAAVTITCPLTHLESIQLHQQLVESHAHVLLVLGVTVATW
jgi:hypothetical protein